MGSVKEKDGLIRNEWVELKRRTDYKEENGLSSIEGRIKERRMG